ncbi:MAG: tRNA (adenosine(37)-N6)-threonylcarbamoyltransferase complex dimerization subunit type 1 TsaB [bacterium]|nr:tRNA (adenosine(37)-N6)-threonylcarbamoyltransferase complex dimerization subunit type 1 TsaB [bacterium]
MFKILALETSTEFGSLALLNRDELLAEICFGGGVTHTERLLPAWDWILRTSRTPLSEIRGLAVGVGPGSFTGLRIGMATVLGMAWARRLPVVGVSSLKALAGNLPFVSGTVCPLIDARKGEIYWSLYHSENGILSQIGEEKVSPLSEILKSVTRPAIFLGTGARRYRPEIEEWNGGKTRGADSLLAYPLARQAGLLAWERFARGESDDLKTLAPNYIRKSEAELTHPEINWEREGGKEDRFEKH